MATVRIGKQTYTTVKRLAEGGFGKINLIKKDGKEYVGKLQNVERKDKRELAEKEIWVLKQLKKNQHIVEMIGHGQISPQELYIVLEYCESGHLLDIIRKHQSPLPDSTVWTVFRDITCAVKDMHSLKISHWDIKLENILKQGHTYKLCDFGSCVMGAQSCESKEDAAVLMELISKRTSPSYRAPEMVEMFLVKAIAEKPDIWALGCVLFACAYSSHPFLNAGNLAIINARYEIPQNTTRSNSLLECLSRCFVVDPSRRADAAELNERADSALNGRRSRFSLKMEAALGNRSKSPRGKARAKKGKVNLSSKQKYQNKAKSRRAQLLNRIAGHKAKAKANIKASGGTNAGATFEDYTPNWDVQTHLPKSPGGNAAAKKSTTPTESATPMSSKALEAKASSFSASGDSSKAPAAVPKPSLNESISQGIRVAIAAELKRRGPHVAFHFKRYLSHLLAPVLRERETQVQVLAKGVVSPPEHTDGAESEEVKASLQALDRSLRQGIRFVLDTEAPQHTGDHVASVSVCLKKMIDPVLNRLAMQDQMRLVITNTPSHNDPKTDLL